MTVYYFLQAPAGPRFRTNGMPVSLKHPSPGHDERPRAGLILAQETVYCHYFSKKQYTVTIFPVTIFFDGLGEVTRPMGMLVRKDNLGFGMRSWRYAAIVDDGVIEAWFEEPGFSDNCEADPYGESAPQNLLYLIGVDRIHRINRTHDVGSIDPDPV